MPDAVLLIDFDQYCHRCCAATERDVKFDDENHILASNEEEAWDTLTGAIRELQQHFGTDEIVMCATDYNSPGFRLSIDPTYKAHRVTRKPLCYWDVRKRAEETWKCVSFPGLEADDVMGILATKPGRTERIIISRDKDMKTIPAKVWNGKEFLNVDKEEADYFHLYQTLIGDASDGYKGCPGVGPKKAEALLEPFVFKSGPGTRDCAQGMGCKGCLRCCTSAIAWPTIVAAYEKAGLTADDALRQARLARILRWEDWDTRKKEVKLWEPK